MIRRGGEAAARRGRCDGCGARRAQRRARRWPAAAWAVAAARARRQPRRRSPPAPRSSWTRPPARCSGSATPTSRCRRRAPPRSLTAIVALESGRLDESFRVSAEAAETAPVARSTSARGSACGCGPPLRRAPQLGERRRGGDRRGRSPARRRRSPARMNVRARAARCAHRALREPARPHRARPRRERARPRRSSSVTALRLPLFREILETRSVRGAGRGDAARTGCRSARTTACSPATPIR